MVITTLLYIRDIYIHIYAISILYYSHVPTRQVFYSYIVYNYIIHVQSFELHMFYTQQACTQHYCLHLLQNSIHYTVCVAIHTHIIPVYIDQV